MAKTVTFPGVLEFIAQHCYETGELNIIMGISMVAAEKAARHYQNGEAFEAICIKIKEIFQTLKEQNSQKSLKLTVVLTGALHRHNIAIQKNCSMEVALKEACELDVKWINGNAGLKGHAGLKDGHRLIMQNTLGKCGIPFEVFTLQEWLFKEGEKTQEANEKLKKIEDLYTTDPELKRLVEEAAKQKVRRELLPRCENAYATLENNLEIAGKYQKDTIESSDLQRISSTSGKLKKALSDIKEQEVYLSEHERGEIKGLLDIDQSGFSLEAKWQYLQDLVAGSSKIFKRVQAFFVQSAQNYLLEEASTVFFFDALGNRSWERSKEELKVLKSNCFMTYKDESNPVFQYVCDTFGLKLPFIAHKIRSPKAKGGVKSPQMEITPLDTSIQASASNNTSTGAGLHSSPSSPSELVQTQVARLLTPLSGAQRATVLRRLSMSTLLPVGEESKTAIVSPVTQDMQRLVQDVQDLQAMVKKSIPEMVQQAMESAIPGIMRPIVQEMMKNILEAVMPDTSPSPEEIPVVSAACTVDCGAHAFFGRAAEVGYTEERGPFELEAPRSRRGSDSSERSTIGV